MHKTDWDRGYEAGKAQGAVDAHAKERDILERLEKAKRDNSRSRIKAELSQAQAEIAGLRAVVEAADAMRGSNVSGMWLGGAAAHYDAARAKLKETT